MVSHEILRDDVEVAGIAFVPGIYYDPFSHQNSFVHVAWLESAMLFAKRRITYKRHEGGRIQ